MSIGRAALKQVGNKPIGPVGYGLLSLSLPWAPVEKDVAVSLLKTALDQGANFWNGVCARPPILLYSLTDTPQGHILWHFRSQLVTFGAMFLSKVP
jgi:hypothetical protein